MKTINIGLDTEFSILNAIQGAAAILGVNGEILAANKHWKDKERFSIWPDTTPDEYNYFNHCKHAAEIGNDYALRLLFGIRDVIEEKKKSFNLTISSDKPLRKWYKAEVSKIHDTPENCVLLVFTDVSENLKTIQTLRESEATYRHYFRHSIAGIILGKPNGEILDVNTAACKILGYSKMELIEGGRKLIVDESDPAHHEVVRIREDKSIFKGEKEYIHKDGHYIPVELTSLLYTCDDGSKQLINTFQDLQNEKRSKSTLEEERRFTKTAVNSLPGIFFVLDSKKQFIRWNDSMSTELGYSDESIIELSVFDIFNETEHTNLHFVINEVFANGMGDFFGEILTKQGENRSYHLQMNTFESNDKKFIVASGVDVTDLVESEKKRQENYQLMKELFENSPIAKVMITPDNGVQNMNQAFIDLFGYTEEEIIGNNVNTLIACEAHIDEAEEIGRSAFKGRPDQRKTIRLKKDRTQVPVLITTVPVRSNGEIIAVYGIYVDLTEQNKLENHLQNSLHQKDILLQEVHHRVKNNLAVIASLLELQIINDSKKDARQQLQEAHNRVYSIAKIHETIYSHEDVSKISFNDYLSSIIDAMPYLVKAEKFNISLESSEEPLILNINQAVPLGLLINELVNLGIYDWVVDKKIELSYRTEGEYVILLIKGLENQIEEYHRSQKDGSFHHLLIKTFIEQIEATVKFVNKDSKSVSIKFKKSDSIKGSSNSLTKQTEIFVSPKGT